ncbi:MAG: hypothetical protein CW338_08720 [Clostridiales bacterium]|nr:hypothetical protein [Clostridiales bacterium]
MNIRTERTRAALIEAFVSCIKEKPVKEITALDISSRAGVDRATFYRHFKGIDEIVSELERAQLEQFRELMSSGDVFGEDTINTVLSQIDRINKINKTAMIISFSAGFNEKLIGIAKEYAFDAWRKKMPRASDEEVELALTSVITAAFQVVAKQADKYSREVIVRYINNMINGIISMYR